MIKLPDISVADAYAIKAVYAGTASPEQQKRALAAIVSFTGYGRFTWDPQSERVSSFMSGLAFAGQKIVDVCQMTAEQLNRKASDNV